MDILSRFVANISVNENTGCWNWTAALSQKGYGAFSEGRTYIPAHRYSYRRFVGNIPAKMFVCHHCDVRDCVNPAHLFIGTAKDNTSDMIKKGRKPKGVGVNCSSLTEADVLKIYKSPRTLKALGIQYGVHLGTIHHIKTGKTWGWLTAPLGGAVETLNQEVEART